MNDQDRRELERLKQRQELLQERIAELLAQNANLAKHLNEFQQRLQTEAPVVEPPPVVAQPVPPPLPVAPLPVQVVAAPAAVELPKPVEAPIVVAKADVEPAAAPATSTASTPPIPDPAAMAKAQAQTEAPLAPVSAASETPAPAAEEKPSFELRLGTFWVARVGIVMMLGGIAWAAYYAYDKYHLGPAGKLAVLYAAAAALLGLGGWLQRKREKEAVRNYGQVVFAGGLAAVYFITYAAYHVANLKVIHSELLDGGLLLGWAAFIVWLADRHKSEVMALFAIGLAYYTSAITNIGLFTLYSNLVLTVAGVFFLVRNRWATLSMASLLATYGGFVYWRFYDHGWVWDLHAGALKTATWFLAAYWIVFTVAGFLSRAQALVERQRALFLSVNNAAYFALVILSMLHSRHGNFPWFAMGYGLVLIALAILARRMLAQEAEGIVSHSYLTQGLLLFTVGLIAKFSGLQLALILAAQCVAQLLLGHRVKNVILKVAANVCAILAAGGALGALDHSLPNWLSEAGVGALLVFNAVWLRWRASDAEPGALAQVEGPLDITRSYFAVLGLLVWLATTWVCSSPEWLAPLLAGEAFLLTLSYHWLKVREITWSAQVFLLAGMVFWHGYNFERTASPWWSTALCLGFTLATSHWWQLVIKAQKDFARMLLGVYALAVVGLLFVWLQPQFAAPHWLAYASLLAIAVTVYGLVTRFWQLAIAAQVFTAVAVLEFVKQIWLQDAKPAWYLALVPIAMLFAFWLLVERWFKASRASAEKATEQFSQIVTVGIVYRWLGIVYRWLGIVYRWLGIVYRWLGIVYRWLGILMALAWVYAYIPAREQVWVLTLVGVGAFALAGWRKVQEPLVVCALYFGAAGITFLCATESVYWPNLVSIPALPVLQQVARRRPERYPVAPFVHDAAIVPGMILFWIFLTRWVMPVTDGLYLVVTSSLLVAALVAAEIGLRERAYRWGALVVLAGATIQMFVRDIVSDFQFWPDILPMLLALALQQLARRAPSRYAMQPAWQTGMILMGCGGVWLFLSRWVFVVSGGRVFMTAAWAGLALAIFGAGFVLRERIYRWFGLGMLACAIGRVIIFDVWALPTIYRILSFMALGGVLLAIGFLYTKYQDRIKQWL